MAHEVTHRTHVDAHRRELVREAVTMALYVAICLLAALTAIHDDSDRLLALV